MEILGVILSSAVVSAVITFLTLFVYIGRYQQKVDTNVTTVEKILEKISEISDRVARLEGGIERDREYIKSKSPLSLTDKGKSLLLDSKGKDYVDANKDSLINAIKAQNPKTAYDVQELARKVIKDQENTDSFNSIKNFAYKEGLKLETIIGVMGIYLRDEALPIFNFNLNDIKD